MALLAILSDGVIAGGTEAIGAALFGIVGWVARNYSLKTKAAMTEENREATQKIVSEVLGPALAASNATLLDKMNGTYLRTTEARQEFANIKNGIARLDSSVAYTQSLINETILKFVPSS